MRTATPDRGAIIDGRSGKGLDREVIVRAALDWIDESGAQQLSMRLLAQSLDVEAMSLYRYVRGREDLLEAVVTLLLEEVGANEDNQLSEHWQGYLQTLSHEIRRIALEHPNAFPLVATRHPSAPWLRPPLRSIELVEEFLTTLIRHGFTDEQAVVAYQTFSSFLLGQLLLEASVRGAETAPVEVPFDEGDATIPNQDGEADAGDSPIVVRLRSLLSEDRGTEQFEMSLETLLDRLDMMISQ